MSNFIEFLKIVVFGVVEGFTEWLPISSTGHLILVENIVHLNVSEEFMNVFRVVIQLGAILAVLVLYFRRLNPFDRGKKPAQKRATWHLWFKFRIKKVSQISYQTAFYIGLFQLLALIPGTSRSGATILGAMMLGCSRTAASEFTFFLGIPVMFGASLLKILHYGLAFSAMELFFMAAAMVIAFVVSMYSIQFLLGYVKKHDFKFFGYYRIVLGVIVLIYFGLTAILTK